MVDKRIYFLKNNKQKKREDWWDIAGMEQFRRKSGRILKLLKGDFYLKCSFMAMANTILNWLIKRLITCSRWLLLRKCALVSWY